MRQLSVEITSLTDSFAFSQIPRKVRYLNHNINHTFLQVVYKKIFRKSSRNAVKLFWRMRWYSLWIVKTYEALTDSWGLQLFGTSTNYLSIRQNRVLSATFHCKHRRDTDDTVQQLFCWFRKYVFSMYKFIHRYIFWHTDILTCFWKH